MSFPLPQIILIVLLFSITSYVFIYDLNSSRIQPDFIKNACNINFTIHSQQNDTNTNSSKPPDIPIDLHEESSLKIYPTNPKISPINSCRRKNQRNAYICRTTGEGCTRYTPTEELSIFWIICPIYTANQNSTERLYTLHRNFISYVKLLGFQTQVIEVVFPGQEYQVTKPSNEPYELQYKADWIFNMRENLVNVGVKKLPDDWQYVAWIDAHIYWNENKHWFEDAVKELNRNNAVQLLESNDFLDTKNQSFKESKGFGYLWNKFHSTSMPPGVQYGVAWATRRDVFQQLGGLLDICIGTKCDLYQDFAMMGHVYTGECSNKRYAELVRSWQENAIEVFGQKVGFLRGNIMHFAHCVEGCQTSNYDEMTGALSRYGFNPERDMIRDSEGRLHFADNWDLAKELWNVYGGAPRL